MVSSWCLQNSVLVGGGKKEHVKNVTNVFVYSVDFSNVIGHQMHQKNNL